MNLRPSIGLITAQDAIDRMFWCSLSLYFSLEQQAVSVAWKFDSHHLVLDPRDYPSYQDLHLLIGCQECHHLRDAERALVQSIEARWDRQWSTFFRVIHSGQTSRIVSWSHVSTSEAELLKWRLLRRCSRQIRRLLQAAASLAWPLSLHQGDERLFQSSRWSLFRAS